MKYYQATLYREKYEPPVVGSKLIVTDIVEKEAVSLPFVIDNDKITILEWYDSVKGKTLSLITEKREILEAFIDGFNTGLKHEDLL
jgi:hypothetical protein